MPAIKLSPNQSRMAFQHHFSLICLSFSSRGCRNTENIEKQWSSHIFMRNVISQIADPAQPAYQGVVRDHFPSNVFKVNFCIHCVYMQLAWFSIRCVSKIVSSASTWIYRSFLIIKLCTMGVCCCFFFICSTSLPGGNQVDGLPPVSSTGMLGG